MTTNNETNRERLQRFYAAVLAGDQATQRSLIHPDFVLYEADGLPYAGEYHGADGWISAFAKIASTWVDIGFEQKLLIGEPDGEEFAWFMGLSGRAAKTGKPFKTTVFELWSVRDGKIFSIRPHYWDTKMMAELLVAN
jgi:ketosteroid isomerase-like protein